MLTRLTPSHPAPTAALPRAGHAGARALAVLRIAAGNSAGAPAAHAGAGVSSGA
jgi:hypothetical protein